MQVLLLIAASACTADRQSQRDTAWAEHFTGAAERIEARARAMGMARLHDVRAEQAELLGWMATLSKEMALGGAEGPGHYALGAGERALGREAEALAHLEAAWNAGFREPRVAWARAQILSERYRALRVEALAAPDKDERKAREQDAEQRYREPVLTLLRQAAGAEFPSAKYGAALVALHEGRLDAALALLEVVGTNHPWFVEARLLRADVFLLRAAERWKEGRKTEARVDLTAGLQAIQDARTTAESFAPAHLAQVRFDKAALNLTQSAAGGPMLLLSPADRYEAPDSAKQGLEALDMAARVDPGHAGFACEKARFLTLLAERPNTYGAFLFLRSRAIEAAQHTLALDPSSPCGHMEWSRVMVQETEEVLKQSPVDFYKLAEALKRLETVPPPARDLGFHLLRARLLHVWTDADRQAGSWRAGSNGWQHQEQAIEAYRSALALEERVPAYWVRMGALLLARGSNPTAKDGDADLKQAEGAFGKAMRGGFEKAPEVWRLGARIQVAQALRQRARGETAPWRFDQAAVLIRNGLLHGARSASLHHELGLILLEQAKETWEHGGDPTALLDQAEAAHAQAATLEPTLDLGRFGQAAVHAARAEYAWLRGADPTEEADRADAFYSQVNPHLRTWKEQRAEGRMKASFSLAHHLLEQGLDPEPALERAMTDFGGLEQFSMDRVLLHRAYGARLRLVARHSARTNPEKAETQFSNAEKHYAEALEVEPSSREARLEAGHLFREWAAARKAAKQEPEPLLSRGLALADALLVERPNWPEARLLRAALLRTKDPASAQARADRDAALKANANLAPGWRRQFPEDLPSRP
ncbi:hypothetical protein KH5H1_07990 [Corallococcus caeni]|uniref:hypothetical protein n=1 Tax=Corallococcus caeni TaxID=3082388 RepID=UPI002957FD1B|nr:hypothetical protein KH5H1_07990 [Corallococcus sp. KH5-1]